MKEFIAVLLRDQFFRDVTLPIFSRLFETV